MKKLLLLTLVLFSIVSCSKDEGYGGLSSISGKVYGKNFNSNNVLVAQYYLQDTKVYISKKGDTNYFDTKTSAYDGSFKFDFLQPGSYDLWVYGDCDFCPLNTIQAFKLVSVDVAKKEDKVIDNIEITF